jgi:zinc transporter
MRSPGSTYGSDEHGLIWGYRFAPGQAAVAIGAAEAVAFLAAAGGDSSFLWLHVALSHAASEKWLRKELSLPEAFFELLRGEPGSTRVEAESGAVVAVLHDVLFGSAIDAAAVGTTVLCAMPRLLLSARLRPLRSLDELRAVVRSGQPFRGSIELLTDLLRVQAKVLSDILRQSTTRIDRIEDGFLAHGRTSDRAELGALRRALVRLQRLLAPEPTALLRLLNRPLAWIAREDIDELQHAADEFATAIADAAALVERIKLIQEEQVAAVNEQTGRTLFLLTVVTVLALPVNLVAGLFGMNVGGIPLAQHEHGFAVVVGVLVVLTVLLTYVAFGRRR